MAKVWQTLLRRSAVDTVSRYSVDQYLADVAFTYNGFAYGLGGSTPTAKTEDIENNFVAYVQQAYKSNGIIFAIMLARMLLFTEARFCWYEVQDDGSNGVAVGRQGLSSLETPWPNGSTAELLARMDQDASFGGNFYAAREDDRLRRLRPDWLTIVLTAPPAEAVKSDVAGYWYHPGRSYGSAEPSPGDQVYLPDEIAHWCVDEETEILTSAGWKDYRGLAAGDEVLTLNHVTGMSEWQPVDEVCVFPAQRRSLVSMEGHQFSSLTTGNHRWAVERKNSRAGRYVRRWATSETLSTGDRIPIAAFCADTPAEQKWTDALVEAVAWFWTEGRYKSGSRPGLRGRGIQIAQSRKNAGNLARIRATLTALFGPASDTPMPRRGRRIDQRPCWRESIDDDMTIFSLSANASDAVTLHAPGKVVATDFLRSLTQSQLELFIHVALLADNNGANRLAQKSPAMAEQFALACILAGQGVSIRPGNTKKRGYRMTDVRVLRKRHVYPQPDRRAKSQFKTERVDYDGHVWCPRTANQTWLARRRGSVYFTGNSPIPDPEAQYRGMSWLTPVLREIQADSAATTHKLKFFQNGATLGTIISAKENLTEKQFGVWKNTILEQHQGVDAAYKPLFLASPVDVSIQGVDMKQLDFKISQGGGETRLCADGGVPPIIVGLSEGLASATYSNYGMARRKFGDHWARPMWKSAAHALSNIVDPPEGDVRLGVNDKDIAFLREDQKDAAEIESIRAATISSYIASGFTPDSSVSAAVAGDPTLLVHTGLTSVQLQPPMGEEVPPGDTGITTGTGEDPGALEDLAASLSLRAIAAGVNPDGRHTARADTNPGDNGNQLKHYWLQGEGLAKWAVSPHPWTSLYHHLVKHMPPEKAKRVAADWFHEHFGFWPGSDMNRVTHGKPPRGDRVGPG